MHRVSAALTFGSEDAVDRIRTIGERRADAMAHLRAAVAELRPLLAAEASRLGDRSLLFGSAARDEMHPDSDTRAWTFAEETCWRLGLTPDIRPLGMTTHRFRGHVLPEAISLP